ncbi:DUF3795 domain-containing protein [Candidatus Bathyarchaeota archaeon]|nr:DUF3795 domain-containing protein [Candidatus Bathyarchaeota archaeon]
MISRCGIYCGACYVYRAQRDGGRFLAETADRQGVPEETVRCDGCTGAEEHLWKNCALCGIRDCLREKGLEYCYQCNEFREGTCDDYERLSEFCGRRGEDIRESMNSIRKAPDDWLCEQREKWSCGACGEPYSWYETFCHHCGSDLGRDDLP